MVLKDKSNVLRLWITFSICRKFMKYINLFTIKKSKCLEKICQKSLSELKKMRDMVRGRRSYIHNNQKL